MRSRLPLLAALALCPLLAIAADDTPQWLKDLSGVTLPAYPAKVNNAVLLNEEHTVMSENGHLTTTTRSAINILNAQGGDVLFFDSYETGTGKVRDFRAWMVPPSGKVKKYGKDEIVDVACAGNDVYNECRRRAVSGKRDAEPGAVFAYESVIEYESFANQLVFHFQNGMPVRLSRFEVVVPAGWHVDARTFNGAPKGEDTSGVHRWQMENLPAMEFEPSAPSFLTLAPWVGVNLTGPGTTHALATWAEAAKVLAGLNEMKAGPNEDALTAKARSLAEGATTDMDKVRAIGRFVQQVNYVSVQTNLARGGGYRPHPADQVFQRLYGDCKDKAHLMRTMLKAVGVTAYPVAIYSGDRTHVSPEWPSLGAFNHAISAIRVPADTVAPAAADYPSLGRLLFFDPTDPYVQPGSLPDHEQASLALVGAPDGGGLVRVPSAAPVAAAHDRTVEATLTADGGLTGQFADRRIGEELATAVSAFRDTGKTAYLRRLERWIGRSVQGAAASGIEVDDASDHFVVRGSFASRTFAQRPQPRMLIFKAGLLEYDDWGLTEKTRRFPVVVDSGALNETIRIKVPGEYRVDEVPDAMKIASPYGKLEATWTVEEGSVVFRRTLEIPAQTVPADQYSALKKFLDTVDASAEAPVVLMR